MGHAPLPSWQQSTSLLSQNLLAKKWRLKIVQNHAQPLSVSDYLVNCLNLLPLVSRKELFWAVAHKRMVTVRSLGPVCVAYVLYAHLKASRRLTIYIYICVCVLFYVYIYLSPYVYIYIYTYIYIHIYIHIYIYIYIYIYTYIYIYIYMYIYIYVYMYVCMHVCVCMYVCM